MSLDTMKQKQQGIWEKLNLKANGSLVPEATYSKFTDQAKIFSLEAIIAHASSVFGPFGGIYTELFMNNIRKEVVLDKSSDGHKYFQSLNFLASYSETVLSLIREKTLYVSGSNGKTSRDGTTSLALISSACSSDVLLNRLANPEKFKIPTSILSGTFGTLSMAFRNICERDKVLIYSPDAADYVSEAGRKAAMSAIATTVDRNPIITDAYSKLIATCIDKGIDITESAISTLPEKETSETSTASLELKVSMGLRFNATSASNRETTAFADQQSPVLILDGYMGGPCEPELLRKLQKFIHDILVMKDESGFYIFSKYSESGIKPPVILYNRGTDLFKKSLEDNSYSVTVPLKINDKIIKETIEPTFLFVQSEEIDAEKYNDLKDIFANNVIKTNGFRRFAFDEARKHIKDEDRAVQNNTPYSNQFDIVKEQGIYENLMNVNSSGEITLKDYDYLSGTNEIDTNSITGVTDRTVRIEDIMSNVSFDGNTLFLRSDIEEVREKADALRSKIQGMKSNLTKMSSEYEMVKKRLEVFNTCTITPHFYITTEDEYSNLYDQYQDAQGVFESVHVHGVMSGGNTTLFKVFDELKQTFTKDLMDGLLIVGVKSEELIKRYTEFGNIVLESIFRGYLRSYEILLNSSEEARERVEEYMTSYSKEPLVSYDIVTGCYSSEVLESTRTTVDTFQSALDVMQDLLQINRVRLQKEVEAVNMVGMFSDDYDFKITDGLKKYVNEGIK